MYASQLLTSARGLELTQEVFVCTQFGRIQEEHNEDVESYNQDEADAHQS